MRDPKILAVALSDRGQHPCRPDIELIEASLTIRGLVRAVENARKWIAAPRVSGKPKGAVLREIDEALSPNGKETPPMNILSLPTMEPNIIHSVTISDILPAGWYIVLHGKNIGPYTSRRDAELDAIKRTQGRCYVC